MARRAQPPMTTPPKLSPEKAIKRLEQRIAELEALDCSSVSSYDAPELISLRSAILTTLEDAFGENSREYHRFSEAASFRQTRVINMGGGFGRGLRGPDLYQIRDDCAKAKERNLALLRTAVQILKGRVEDQVNHRSTVETSPERKEQPAIMYFHNVHSINGNIGIGNTSGAITSVVNVEGLKKCISELRRYERELAEISGLTDLPKKLGDVEDELAKPTPDQRRVASTMTDIRNALSAAAGNMLAAGAMALIRQVIGG